MTKLRDEGLGELGTFEIEHEISIQDSHIVSRVASILRLVPCDSAAEHVLEDRSGTVRNGTMTAASESSVGAEDLVVDDGIVDMAIIPVID